MRYGKSDTRSLASEEFLSSNTQDFIEVSVTVGCPPDFYKFLSSNTQDFIEVRRVRLMLRTRLGNS